MAPGGVEAPNRATDTSTTGRLWAARYRTKLRLTDMLAVVASVGLALLLANVAAANAGGSLPTTHWLVPVVVAATWIITLGAFHTRSARVVGVGSTEYKRVVNASALSCGVLALIFLLLQVENSRAYFLIAFPLGTVALSLERWLWCQWLLHQRQFGHYLARAIVVGHRADVEYVIDQIEEKSGAAYRVVGVALDDDTNSSHIGTRERSVPVVADLAHAAGAAANMGVDTVIVGGHPNGGSTFIRTLAWQLEGTPAELALSSRLTDVAGPRIHFRPVEGLPLIHVEIPQFEGGKHVLKRALDIAVCSLALLILLPLLAVLAVLIKLDSPGPALFRQERCGRNGQSFRMVKFRSMVQTAEDDLAGLLDQNEAAGVLFKIRNDPRITGVGRVLRKYSLDELPQLWHILVGDMSLVGPRPPLRREVDDYESHVHRRLYIKPGLTGMWQVNGRSDLGWEESVRLDLYYVANWSLIGDLVILWRTVRVLTHPTGAY
ncbi:MAG: sugar transferase [Cryobacterium sp.]